MYRRLFCCLLTLSFSLSLSAQSSPDSKIADKDPNAMGALNKMGEYRRTLKTFQVKAVETTDEVLDNGQAAESSQVVDVLATKPNRLRVNITSDDMDRLFLYDGKNFTIYGQLTNYYATVPAPPTITELIDKLGDRYDISIPLMDLFLWGGPGSPEDKRITSAIDLGPSTVESTTCEQYAFRQDGLDWQIWIQLGEDSLPRKLVLITTDEEARPRHTEILTWNLAPSFDEASYTFDPPKDAQRITLKEFKAPAGDEKK
jgi:hypothetical protein